VAFLGVEVNLLSFTKAKRAQNVNDFESWISGGVAPTLNAMDNNGEAFATVLIIDGTRVDDVRVYEDGIVPTVISRYGTGGGNVPMVFPIDDARELEKNQNGTGIGAEGAPAYTLDRQQAPAIATESVVRRLTPVECERLQGFPDDWTSGQADSNRYKQMGNAVAVPVAEWIISRMVGEDETN
jgi:DNA (cytosine-5)-methyltransferase 1